MLQQNPSAEFTLQDPYGSNSNGNGMETFDPFASYAQTTAAALYGGAPECPWDPEGNYLCICEP